MATTAAIVAVGLLWLVTQALALSPPTVSAIWPRVGPVAGGTPITVVGSGFSAGSPSVTVDGIAAGSVTVVSDTVLKVTAPSVPGGVPTTGSVVVTTPQGTSTSSGPRSTYTYRGGSSLAVPSYFYPFGSSWNIVDGPPRTADLAIINPASGPGSFDPNYATQAAASQAAGVDVIGYVDTSYARRSLSAVEADITRYEQWYHVDGIFLDEATVDCATEASYFAPLDAFIHAQVGLDLTVLNTGAPTPSCYMNASDVVITFEGTPSALSGAATVPGYDPSRFWGVVYGATTRNWSSALTTLANDGFGETYVTNLGLPNPYNALPSFWSSEVSAAATSSPPPPPSVGAINPTTGPAGGGTQVTISGANLTGGTVSFGSTPASGVSCTASSCTATSPAGSGTVHVTVTTTGGTSTATSADQFVYQAPLGPPNLLPDPGFETSSVPADYWASSVARSGSVVHSGSWALAQTLSSSSGGWSLDLNPGWSAPLRSTQTYTGTSWVRASAPVRVNLSIDLLDASGAYVDSASGPWVTLAANTWTQLTVTGVAPTSAEPLGVLEPDFSNGASGTVIYWDDMSITTP